jgi:excisionase family DNA binding protein
MAYATRETTSSARQMIDLPRLCELLGISVLTGHNLLRAGKLPAYRVGSTWRFDEAEVRDALRAQPGEHWVQGPRTQPDKARVPA